MCRPRLRRPAAGEGPVRILHVSQPSDYGVARCVAALAADQVARGWSVSVACAPHGWLADAVRSCGASLVSWSASREVGPGVPGEVRRLARVVEAGRPSVVHLHSSKAGLAGRLAVRGRVPTLFHTHAWSFLGAGPRLAPLAVAWERWAVRWADAVVCCSEGEAGLGRSAGIPGPLVVVPNAVDSSWVLHGEEACAARAAVRAELGLGEAPLAVCIGRLAPQKGQDVLLDAWPAVRAAVADARLALVGDGPERAALQRRLSPGVELVGRRSDVAAWLAAADVVTVPSRYDGMSLTLLEALAAGRSVVVSDAPGVAEVITAAEDSSGAVVPVGDAPALAAALAVRLADPGLRRAEGAAARRHAQRAHDIRAWLDRLAGLAESLSGAGARGRARG